CTSTLSEILLDEAQECPGDAAGAGPSTASRHSQRRGPASHSAYLRASGTTMRAAGLRASGTTSREAGRQMRITLLGPQRRPTLEGVAASLHPEGPVATITAGWQEREGDDAELGRLLGSRDVNLRLHARWLDVQERDPLFAVGERRMAELLGELQDLYLLRLDHALQAVYPVRRRGGHP